MTYWNEYRFVENFRIFLLVLLLGSAFQIGLGQEMNLVENDRHSDDSTLVRWIKASFENGLDTLNVPGATMTFVRGDSVIFKTGYGIESLETKLKVSPDSSIFHLGSISKTFLALAVMQLYEKGLIELDQDVNKYLTSFQIDQKFTRPITVSHLLTHSAGFDERNLLIAAKYEADRPELAEHLKERLPPQIRTPGLVFTYSNYGYTTLGVMVEDISGLPFHQYVEENILLPLGMNKSGFYRRKKFKDRYVPSYRQVNDDLIKYEFNFMNLYPAGSFTSTSSDMGRYISMLLKQGRSGNKTIIDSTTFKTMVEKDFAQFDESEVRWALGFEKHIINGKTVLEHRGDVQGFTNYLIIYPDHNTGIFVSMNASRLGGGVSDSRKFLASFEQQFENKLFNTNHSELTSPKPSLVKDDNFLDRYTGNYRYTRYAHTTFDKVAAMIGFAPEISIQKSGQNLYIQNQQDTLFHIKNHLFYSKRDSTYSAFAFDIDGVNYFFRDGITSFEKLGWYESLNFQIPWVIAIVLLQVAFLFYLLGRRLLNKKRLNSRQQFLQANTLNSILILVFLSTFIYTLTAIDPVEFTYKIPLFFKAILFVPFGIFVITFLALWRFYKNFKKMQLGIVEASFFTLVILSSVNFLFWLEYWNLIGLNY